MKRTPFRLSRLAATAALLACSALPARATWSIVVLDRGTREVAIASATCLVNDDLAATVPILRVGRGAVANQALALNNQGKKLIKKGLTMGLSPHHILEFLINLPSDDEHQYGIVTLSGPPVSWSGDSVCNGLDNRVGVVGDIAYAIQGNLLTGKLPVEKAEEALLTTPGDMSQRLMAAMQAARLAGGDGRCSCDLYQPGGNCGAPGGQACGSPPAGFDPETDKSAHTAFVIVSRMGDLNAPCTVANGCANGDYYLNVEFNGVAEDPDPVVMVQHFYDAWRSALIGRPDGLLSTVEPRQAAIPADGSTVLQVDVALVDVDGTPLTEGGAIFTATSLQDRPPSSEFLFTDDHGDGTYSLFFQATEKPGDDVYRLQIDDGVGRLVTLYPDLQISVEGP